ncbi:hypothetical protein AWB74_08457 [Caballeronia arvi]|uniref:Preprotein translocase subunit SecB n=1 Tax=Caballeronia arvi TaxID=1777135 RepID=A0A158L490_9BURK|nr:hypothetical protein [Caballeronia arvi]SAL88217.1 hypothetical protein AWB74_08457 [Caballeronia arvi]
MNVEALQKVRDHLAVQEVYPSKINLRVSDHFDPMSGDQDSYSRIVWAVTGVHGRDIQMLAEDGTETTASVLIFRASTRVMIVADKGSGPRPEDEEVPPSEILGELEVDFRITYLVQGIKGDGLDQEGLKEYANANVPYHFWPYWREIMQSLSARAKLPVPTLPLFLVSGGKSAAKKSKSEPKSEA